MKKLLLILAVGLAISCTPKKECDCVSKQQFDSLKTAVDSLNSRFENRTDIQNEINDGLLQIYKNF